MFLNNRFSKVNSMIYKAKCVHCRENEYIHEESNELDRYERFTPKNEHIKKTKEKK